MAFGLHPSADDRELAEEMQKRIGWTCDDGHKRKLAELIREVRTETLDLAALACEHYADNTTFMRKAAAARECAARIRKLARDE